MKALLKKGDTLFIRQESIRSMFKHYPIVSWIIVIHLALFLMINLFPGGRLILYWGVGQNGAISAGEYWRILTPIFLHASFPHVLFNSFSLYLFGPALERMLGKITFIVSYLFMGVAANLATFWLEGPLYTHLGASGSIYGLFGIYLYMSIYRKDLIDRMNSQIVLTILVLGLIMTFVAPNINVLAHLFGLIAGAAIAPIVLYKARKYTMIIEESRSPFQSESSPPTFNPKRWERRHRMQGGFLKKFIWGLFILAVIIGFFLTL